MKISNYLGDNMPTLPWMINYDCPLKKTCIKNFNISAPNYLDYLANVKLDLKQARTVLTSVMVTLRTNNSQPEFLDAILEEGIRAFTVDISSGTPCEQISLFSTLRGCIKKYSDKIGREYPVGIALELAGFRMQTGHLDSHELEDTYLEEGNFVYVTPEYHYECHCNRKMIYINNPDILKILTPGDQIYIDYGLIILEVVEIGHKYKNIKCKVMSGGRLRDEAVIHFPKIPVDFETEIRTELITLGIKHEIDALIVPRTRNSYVIESIKNVLAGTGKSILLIAKIEEMSGIDNIDEIIEIADAIIIARGELGMNIPPEKLFIAQKMIIAKCNKAGKPVISGTHILKSMESNRILARSDMLDVPNAIIDGSDGILLSEEITNSPYFFEAIRVLKNMCKDTEAFIFQKDVISNLTNVDLPNNSEPIYSIAMSALELSIKCKSACIIVCTVSGRSARLVSRYRPKCPIIAVTRYGHIARKLNLWRGVIPIHYIAPPRSDWLCEIDSRIQYAITFCKWSGLIKGGDSVVLISGRKELSGFTNTVRIIYVSQNNMAADICDRKPGKNARHSTTEKNVPVVP